MSRTFKKDPPNPYQKERKPQRKQHHRKYRHNSNRILRDFQTDEIIEPFTRTSGWLTH